MRGCLSTSTIAPQRPLHRVAQRNATKRSARVAGVPEEVETGIVQGDPPESSAATVVVVCAEPRGVVDTTETSVIARLGAPASISEMAETRGGCRTRSRAAPISRRWGGRMA